MKPKIRTELARLNLLKKVPDLLFERDILKASQASAASCLDALESEMSEGISDVKENESSLKSAAVDAAIQALSRKMQPLPSKWRQDRLDTQGPALEKSVQNTQ
jgi:hypothetical protein